MPNMNSAPLIIKRVDADHEPAHHGGAWKVAYADFMTAMMAFFLLMWIISTADEEKLHGIADYFTPTVSLLSGPGGEGALEGVQMAQKGTMTEVPQKETVTEASITPAAGEPTDGSEPESSDPLSALAESLAADQQQASMTQDQASDQAQAATAAQSNADEIAASRAADSAAFDKVKAEINDAMASSPELQQLIDNVRFEQTPDGLMIQIVDQDGRSMFASGSSHLTGATRSLMEKLGEAISGLPNDIVIAGHTDAVPFSGGGDYGNWELSADRANATRRVFMQSGVPSDRIVRISGLADTDPLIPDDPRAASNRRITVHLIYQDLDVVAAEPKKVSRVEKKYDGTGTL